MRQLQKRQEDEMTTTAATFVSTFALLDVKRGRKELEKRLRRGERIELVLHGVLDNDPRSIGHDDGESREFTLNVTLVECLPV